MEAAMMKRSDESDHQYPFNDLSRLNIKACENTFPKIDLLSLSINERVIVVVESLIVFVERLDTD